MNSAPDFEDMLALLNEHQVRYLIIGGNAFWIDLESLWRIKSAINHPRHQDDARVLRRILEHKHAKNKSTMEME